MGKRSSKTKNKIKNLQRQLRWARKHPKTDLHVIITALAILSLRYPNHAENCDKIATKLGRMELYEQLKDAHYERNCW